MTYTGFCHCGQIRYDIEGKLGTVNECNCSHCSRKGYLLWFLPRTALKALATYTFNRHVIKHHFCPNCGCAPFGLGKNPKGEEMVAINERCLETVELAGLPACRASTSMVAVSDVGSCILHLFRRERQCLSACPVATLRAAVTAGRVYRITTITTGDANEEDPFSNGSTGPWSGQRAGAGLSDGTWRQLRRLK